MRVVIADDSILFLERLKALLQTLKGVEIVGISNNGKDAVDKIKATNPDLAIIDIKMPKMNGIEVINEVRKENKKVKIMVITFYNSELYRKLSLSSGSNYYFSKVDEFDKIIIEVNELMLNKSKCSLKHRC